MELNLSIGKILLSTYVIISSALCLNLFSNNFKKTLETNRYAQHVILIILILTLVIDFGSPFGLEITTNKTVNIAIVTLIIYIWFILTSKLDCTWNIATIILLIIYYLYESKITSDLQLELKEATSSETKSIQVSNFIKNNNYVLLGIFAFTLIGTLLYTSEKQTQYGEEFNLINFWFY